ncbi:MAG: DUF11 domain-containing protein [Ignavibacteriales bacterium]|nr:DUF11 domain-containing protein [Ignavibacteriales bacterium]
MKKFIYLFVASICIIVMTDIAYAVGTPAGTVIQSRSRVIYSTASGASTDTVYSNYVSFTIAQVGAVNLTPSSNASTTDGDSLYVAYPLTVTNSGNGTDYFKLSYVSSKGWTGTFYFDANGDGSLQAGEISAGSISQSSNIAADATYKLMVRIFVPRGGSLNGQIDTTVVTTKSNFDSTKTNTAQIRTTVNTVNIPNIGTALTVTPTNPTPGQNVQYSLIITNSGSVAATGVTFTDLINTSQFSFISGTTTQGTFNGSIVPATWTVGTINPGGSVTVTITLQVLPTLPNGTQLNNQINVNYTVGGNTFTITSNNPYAAVGVVRNVQISPTAVSSSNEADDTLAYAFTVKNTGNSKDVLEMEYNSSKSYTWVFFRDVNNSGTYDAGDTQLTNTNTTPTTVDVDSVAATDSVKILGRLIVPKVTTDEEQDVTTFTVRSSADNTKFQSAIGTTTIGIPVIDLVRSVTPAGNQPPGEEMTFQVAYQNNGHGKAYNFSVTENEADSMSYVANSVTIDNVAKTDAADADEVTVTTVSGRKVITINIGILNALSTQGIIRYRATIH